MKRIISLLSYLCAVLLFTGTMNAQTTVSIPDTTAADSSEVLIPLNTSEIMEDVGAVTLNIAIEDTSALEYVEIVNSPLSNPTINYTDGVIKFAWVDFDLEGVDVEDKIFDIKFNYYGGSSAIEFTGDNEIADKDGQEFDVTFENGSIAGLPTKASIGSVEADSGAVANLPLNAVNFSNVGSITFKLEYNNDNVEFVGVANDTVDFVSNASDGVLTLAWAPADLEPLNVGDGKLADLQFELLGGNSDVNFIEGENEVTDIEENEIEVIYENGQITQAEGPVASFSIPDVEGRPGTDVAIPLNGTLLSDLGAFQFDIQYDEEVLDFVEVDNVVSGDFVSNEKEGGVLSLAYVNQDGLEVDDGKVADLVFTYNGGTSDIEFDPASLEFTKTDGEQVSIAVFDGSIEEAEALNLTIAEIQTPDSDTTDASPYVDQLVTTSGIVTGKEAGNGFYIQDGEGAWNGIWVYVGDSTDVELGDEVEVTSVVTEYFELTELEEPESIEVLSTGNELPEPVLIQTANLSEEFEGVLVEVKNAEATDSLGYGEWEVDDGSGPMIVDDQMYEFLPELGQKYDIVGIGNFSFGDYKLEPRFEDDISMSKPDAEEWAAIFEESVDNEGLTRGMDVNPTTDHLLLASRVENKIHILDRNYGLEINSLPFGEIDLGGGLWFNVVGAAESGEIYLGTLTLADGGFKIVKWDNENDSNPITAFEGEVDSRVGDVMTVVGSGENTLIYASGSGSEKIYVFSTDDGDNFSIGKEISVDAGLARGGIAPVSADIDSDIWVNGAGTQATLIDSDGNVISEIPEELVNIAYHQIDYMEASNGDEYIAVGAGNSEEYSKQVQIYNVNDVDDPWLTAYGEFTEEWNSNPNGTGAVKLQEVEEGEYAVYQLVTDNVLAAYSTTDFLPIEELMTLTHDTGDLQVDVLNEGSVGSDRVDRAGNGMVWKGENGLWTGGLVFGSTARGYANGTISSWLNVSDNFVTDIERFASTFKEGFMENTFFDQKTRAFLTDYGAEEPYEVGVGVESYAAEDSNFVILNYAYVNIGEETLEDFYGGLFLDFDVDAYAENRGDYEISHQLAYQYHPSEGYYYGAVALNEMDGARVTGYYPDNEENGRENAMDFLSTFDDEDPSAEGDDYRTFIGSKVGDLTVEGKTGTIEPDDTAYAAFALVAGDDYEDLIKNAESAINYASEAGFTDYVVGVNDDQKDEDVLPSEFALEQNYPNPFNPTTTIKFALPFESKVDISVYNLLGQKVTELVSEVKTAGYHKVQWDASKLASGIYIYRIDAKALNSSKQFNDVKKMMLVK